MDIRKCLKSPSANRAGGAGIKSKVLMVVVILNQLSLGGDDSSFGSFTEKSPVGLFLSLYKMFLLANIPTTILQKAKYTSPERLNELLEYTNNLITEDM